jgi:hypothetical protein
MDYSKLKVPELKVLCKNRGISGCSGLLKPELIKVLKAGDAPSPKKGKSPTKKSTITLDISPPKKKASPKKQSPKKLSFREKSDLKKIQNLVASVKSAIADGRDDEIPETIEVIESIFSRSGSSFDPTIQSVVNKLLNKYGKKPVPDTSNNIQQNIIKARRIVIDIQSRGTLLPSKKSLDDLRDINARYGLFLKEPLKQEIIDILFKYRKTQSTSVRPLTLPPVQPPSPVKPPTPKKVYVPGKYDYENIDLLSFNFGRKDDVRPQKEIGEIGITLEELRKEVNNPKFISAFTQSVKDLMVKKLAFYKMKLAEAKSEYDVMKTKVQRLKIAGADSNTIKEMFPMYDMMNGMIIDLEELIEIVKKRSQDANDETTKKGLVEAIEDPTKGIANMVGRKEVKDQIASQLYSFSKGYKTFYGSFNNIAIYGVAGSGKSHLAISLAFAFSKSGILARNFVKIVTRADLVGSYIGQTAPRTRALLLQCLEGILFIDEAYQLTECPDEFGNRAASKDFGAEAVTEMINFLDKYIGMNIVIVAGYQDKMTKCFMTFNEGLPRRFPFRYTLAPYTVAQLTDILVINLERKMPPDIIIDKHTKNFLYSVVDKMSKEVPDSVKNQAGDMLNLSSAIGKAINGSFKIQWINGDLAHNVPILLSGIEDFLEMKGLKLLS